MYLFNNSQQKAYEEFINRLYRCSNIPDLQLSIVNYIHKLVPAESSIMLFYEDDGYTVNSSLLQNLDTGLFEDYLNHYQEFDQYKKKVNQLNSPPAVNRASDFLNYHQWGHNEHRADFLLPQGIYHISCLEIIKDNKIAASLALHRTKKQDNFSDRELNILRILSPIIKNTYHTLKIKSGHIELAEQLTARERQLLPLLVSKLSNQELADHFNISINTIKTHIRNILRKYDCSSRFELVLALKHRSKNHDQSKPLENQ